MKYVHFCMQGKGGAGKSFVANIISQYVRKLSDKTLIIDTDPLNQSLLKIKKIEPVFFDLFDKSKEEISKKKFDFILEEIVNSDADHVVIDTGSSSFVQLSSYIKGFGIIQTFNAFGYNCLFHFVVNGGSEQNEAMRLTTSFCEVFYKVLEENMDFYLDFKPLVIWFNPMPAELEFKNEFNDFYHDDDYIAVEEVLSGIVNLPIYASDGIVKSDVLSMMRDSLTFDEYMLQKFDKETGDFSIIGKQRIRNYQNQIYNSLKNIII